MIVTSVHDILFHDKKETTEKFAITLFPWSLIQK